MTYLRYDQKIERSESPIIKSNNTQGPKHDSHIVLQFVLNFLQFIVVLDIMLLCLLALGYFVYLP